MAEGVEKKAHDRKQKTTSSKASGEGVQGSERRRMYPLFFKLQVLKSFREDPDCKGNQRATARKYGIHRRQVQKWLVAEQSLRKSMGQPDAAAPVCDVATNAVEEEEAAVPDVEMRVPEPMAASPLTRDESASSDGIVVCSSSSSSYSDEGPESPGAGQPSLGFLVSVLNAFHDAPEWHGREAATAQKFGIKRWQLRRWLKKEAEIRAEAAACSRYCGEGFRTPDYPRCDFSPADCTLPDQGACDLSPRCNAAHLDRVVPHASPLLVEQQVCTAEGCPLVGGYCAATPSPPAYYDREAADRYSKSPPSPPTADGCLDFSMGKRRGDSAEVDARAKFYRHEDAAARLPAVEVQVRVLDLRKLPAEGSHACPGGRSGECPASPPLQRARPLAPPEADSCGGAAPRWPAPLPPPAHTPWPAAELRPAFAAVPPPAHCAHLYW